MGSNSSPSSGPQHPGNQPVIPFRYVVAFLLFFATLINYADRLMLSVVSPFLRQELRLTEQDYSQIVSLFLLAYAIMYAGSGPIADWLGTRRSFAVFVCVWSAAAVGHALAFGKWSLAAWRFLLGLGEPGNWPAAAKAVSEWFPAEQRALGIGIFNAGSSMGSMLAPPMVAFLTLNFGWRSAFIFTGSLGFVWLILWLWLYQPPSKSKFISAGEWQFLKGRVRPPDEARPKRFQFSDWLNVLRRRGCYTLIMARFFTDPVIYFLIFWLPEYLQKERGFDLAMIGKYAWAPFLFGDIGYVFGGWLSGHLMQRGWTLTRARFALLAAAGCITPVAIFAPRVPEAWMAIACTSAVTFAHALWISNLLTLPTDLFKGAEVGTASGLSGMGGAIGGALANLGTGWLVSRFSYTPVFLLAGLMHPTGCLIVFTLLYRRMRRHEAERTLETV